MIISRKKFNQEIRKEYWRGFRFAMTKVHEDMKHEALNILNLNANDITFGDPTEDPGSLVEQMTREEINHFAEEMKKVRVQVVEQEPCEDAISRKELKKWLDMNFSFGGASRKIELFDRLDKELSPVTPTRKKGKWIKVKNGRGGHECSICQMYAPSYQSGDEYLSRFCPNCGAEMENEENEHR